MKRRCVRSGGIWFGVMLLAVALFTPIDHARASAHEPTGLVIRTVQAIGKTSSGTASHELIEIYNPTLDAIDVTNWSIVYTPASGNGGKAIVTIKSSSPSTRILLGAGERETMMHQAYAPVNVDTGSLLTFSIGLNHTGGSLSLVTGEGRVVDMVGWGDAVAAVREGSPAPAMKASEALRRVGQDTDDNGTDFAIVDQGSLTDLTYGNLYEETDVCINISGIQEVPPSGYEVVQGICLKPFVPAQLRLSEVLPNPNGADQGKEFIELYNGSDYDVSLADYYMKVGSKIIHFPAGATISALSYGAWSDSEIGVTFANTTGAEIGLYAVNDELLDHMPAYQNAAIDHSWAWLHSLWAYTNRPTMGSANLESLLPAENEEDDGRCNPGYYFYAPTGRCRKTPTPTSPAPCKDGQYRSEETGRCRMIALSGGTLKPCKEGRYRSEETNRCRSLISAVATALKPCREDQFRNPETGRCKKIANASTGLKPCQPGQERNPATNRCRKIQDASVPQAAFPVEKVAATTGSSAMWWIMGGIGASAVGYAGWEWRREVADRIRRLLTVFSGKK